MPSYPFHPWGTMTAMLPGAAQPPDGAHSRLTTATAVLAQGGGRYLADLDAEFSVAGKLNGGYLLAVLVNAARLELASADGGSSDRGPSLTAGNDAPADSGTHANSGTGTDTGARPGWGPGAGPSLPVACTAHYLGQARPGSAVVLVDVLRRGGSTAQVRARLVQETAVLVDAGVTFARPGERAPWSDGPVVALPSEAECFPMSARVPGAPFETPLMGVIEERLDPACCSPRTPCPRRCSTSGTADGCRPCR